VYIEFCWGNLRERDNVAALIVGRSIILSWIFRKWDGEHGLDRSGSG